MPQATPAPGAPAWSVVSQSQMTAADDAGQFVEGVRVAFRTSAGHTGSIFVPLSVYTNADEVRRRLAAAAAHMDAVGSLSG